MKLINAITLAFCLLFVGDIDSAEKQHVLTGKYVVDGGLICLEINGSQESMLAFDEHCRSTTNPKWRDDEFQLKNHNIIRSQIKKGRPILIRLTPENDEDSEIVTRSNKRFQKGIDSFEGVFSIVNPLPAAKQ